MAEMRVGVGARVWASKTVLKIRCKSSLEYLGTSVTVVGTTGIGSFTPESLASCSKNSNLGVEDKSGGATEGSNGKEQWKRVMERSNGRE